MERRMIKKIDIYLLRNFLGLFLATFFIAIFILLMQFMWMHVNDLVGKGIGIGRAGGVLYLCHGVGGALGFAIGDTAQFDHLVR